MSALLRSFFTISPLGHGYPNDAIPALCNPGNVNQGEIVDEERETDTTR